MWEKSSLDVKMTAKVENNVGKYEVLLIWNLSYGDNRAYLTVLLLELDHISKLDFWGKQLEALSSIYCDMVDAN